MLRQTFSVKPVIRIYGRGMQTSGGNSILEAKVNANPITEPAATSRAPWRQAVAGYQSADLRRSIWQIVNTFVPYIILWILMVRSLQVSYWLTLALAIPTAGFLMRIFIFFHDCGHGSFFKTSRANDVFGIITGVLTFTPYYAWRHSRRRAPRDRSAISTVAALATFGL